MSTTELQMLLLNLRYISNTDIDSEDIRDGIKNFIAGLIYPFLAHENSSSHIKADLIRLRESTRMVLDSIIKIVDSSLRDFDELKKDLHKLDEFRNQYPFYVRINHPPEAVNFFSKLDKDEYSSVEAAVLLGITRQTISKYINEGLHGFKKVGTNKKIPKEQIYNYYLNEIVGKK